MTLVTHAVGVLVGVGLGWWLKGHYAAKAAAELVKLGSNISK